MIRLALTYGAVGFSSASVYLGLGQGQEIAAASALVVGILLVGVRLGMAGALPRPSRSTARRAGAVGVSAVIVSGMVLGGVGPGGGMVGTASAEWVDCNMSDSLIGAAYNTLIGADTDCRWQAGDTVDYQNMSAVEGYSHGLGIKDSADSYTATTGNLAENSRTVAISKAKINITNSLNNGETATIAKANANETIDEYYSRAQMQVIQDWNAKMAQIESLAMNSNADIGYEVYDGSWGTTTSVITDVRWESTTYTLANGTSVTVQDITHEAGGVHYSPVRGDHVRFYVTNPDDGNTEYILHSADYGINTTNTPPTHDRLLLQKLENHEQYVADNMGVYTDGVYSQYNQGEINSTGLAKLDPSVIGSEASTEFNSTGYYGHASIMLASMGLGGNHNVSHSITVENSTGVEQATYNGTLYYTADDDPAGGWETGTTYNMSNFGGTFYFAAQKSDGSGAIVDLSNDGTHFTISEATNTKTGESVNSTEVQRYTYDSTNASALASELERLKDLRQQYENTDASGGSGGFDLGGKTGAIGALLAVVVILALTRD